MSVMKTLTYGSEAWKHLKGVFCIYKPSGLSTVNVQNTLCFNLCRDLNNMDKREIREIVSISGSVCSNKPFQVEMIPNYADHELVSGLRYQKQDIKMSWMYPLGWNTSGVLLMAVNDACWKSRDLRYTNFVRKYEVKGKFGFATRTLMSDGIVIERSTYRHIKESALDRLLGSIQAAHQTLAFQYSGIDIQSQEAYEIASKGLIKPCVKTDPLIYSIKCTVFNLPDFTLEIHCINETEDFLKGLVHNIGIDLRSSAVCTQLRQTQFGHFTLSHALLRKHWTLEHILNNLTLCEAVLSEESNATDPKIIKAFKQNQLIEDMQNKTREEYL